MKPHRIALVGTGQSVGNHLRAVQAVGDRVELVAAVDIDKARVKAICEEHGIPNWYPSTSEMLAVEQPDLVSIITPPATHKSLIVECLEAGAWVFCEKPLCASLAELDEIGDAEQRTGRKASTIFQWRFGSAAKHLKHLIDTQVLGRPLVGICNTLWYRTPDYYRIPWRGKWKTELGGPTMTLGIHLIDLFLWLMGDWKEVCAMTGTLDRDIEVEDVSIAIVRFENGAMASIANSVLSPRQESYIRLDFQQATVEVNALYRYSNANWRFSQPVGDNNPEVQASWLALTDDVASGHGAQLSEVLDSIERHTIPPVSGKETRRSTEFVASLYKSALTRQPVRRGDITPDDPFYHAMNGTPQNVARI